VRTIEHGNLLDEAGARKIKKAGAYLVPTMVTYEAIWREGKAYGVGEHRLRKISMARGEERRGADPRPLGDLFGLITRPQAANIADTDLWVKSGSTKGVSGFDVR
jgi:hypothetical protein